MQDNSPEKNHGVISSEVNLGLGASQVQVDMRMAIQPGLPLLLKWFEIII